MTDRDPATMPTAGAPSGASESDVQPAHLHYAVGEKDPWWSRAFLSLTVAAMGVVYGDIGTSPLYTWNEIRRHGALQSAPDVLGACSLIFWTLTLIAFGKYVGLAMQASNNGEGGTFALLSQVQPMARRGVAMVIVLLMFASALLYADGLITPAISVLSAVEGLAVVDPRFEPVIVPITLVILTGLFAVQYHGTERVGRAFGAIMVVWFAVIGGLGLVQIVREPGILLALSPHYGLSFLLRQGIHGSAMLLGSVVLCITGGEALFADMGHFGARAIRAAWVVLVYPALLLQYFGQGAKLLSGDPIVQDNVFYSMVPSSFMLPMVALATMATIIASQALISGAFSLTRSAINLGLLPRVAVVHTNREVEGQIYMPFVNWALWLGCCWLVVEFTSSSNLAAAYGLAVMGSMCVTTIAMAYVARFRWGWPAGRTWMVFGPISVIEFCYLGANVPKIPEGAWLPLLIGSGLYATMRVWQSGRSAMAQAYTRVDRFTVAELLKSKLQVPEIPRAMVFLTAEKVLSYDDPVPLVLLKFVDRYGALPRYITLFSVVLEGSTPYWRAKRFDVRQFGDNVTSVRMHVGYMETPNTRAALMHLKQQRQIRIHATRWTIVMGREELILEPGGGIWRVPHLVFSFLASWASQANEWFGLGSDTGLSKEVIPIVVDRHGKMQVVIRKPELMERSALSPRSLPPTPAPLPLPSAELDDDRPVLEDTSVHELPPVVAQNLSEAGK